MNKKPAHNFNERWRSEDVKAAEKVPFSSFLLKEKLLAGLRKAGFMYPSPVQLETLSMGLYAKDLIIQAKAGTGKTLVFAIIALELLKPEVKTPQVLILAPTREIAVQNCNVIKAVGSKLHVTCRTFIGGMSVSDDMENSEKCQIVVGTPGRIRHLVNSGHINTQYIRLFVMDEADQLIQGIFKEEVEEIFQSLPTEKQVIATSATYPENLTSFSEAFFRNPHFTRLNAVDPCLLGITHYSFLVKCSNMTALEYRCKLKALDHILGGVAFAQCLIFCNSVAKVDTLCADIKNWGFSTISISSAKEQINRLKALEDLQKFRCKILVSSDLSSRGIDAENVDLIINFDMPYESTIYVNRVGRAGRFGTKGVAITIITEKQALGFSAYQKAAKFTSYALTEPVPKNLLNIRPIAPPSTPAESANSAEEIYKSFKQQSFLAKKKATAKNRNRLKNVEHREIDAKENTPYNETPSEEEEYHSIDEQQHDSASNSQELSDGEVENMPKDPQVSDTGSTDLVFKTENGYIEEDCGDSQMENFGDDGSDTKDPANELNEIVEYTYSDLDSEEADTPAVVNVDNDSPGVDDRPKSEELPIGIDKVLDKEIFTSQHEGGAKSIPCSPEICKDMSPPIKELVEKYEAREDISSAVKETVAEYEACEVMLDPENGTVASIASIEDPGEFEISTKDVTEIRTSRESFFDRAIKAYQEDMEAAKARKEEVSENGATSSDSKNTVAVQPTPGIDSERSAQKTSTPRKAGMADASAENKNVSFADKDNAVNKKDVSAASEEKSVADPNSTDIYISSCDEDVPNPLVAYRELRNADHVNDEKRLRMMVRKKKWELKCAQRKTEDLEKSAVDDEHAGDVDKAAAKTTKKKKQRKSMKATSVVETANYRYEDENVMPTKVGNLRQKQHSKTNPYSEEKPKQHRSHKIMREKHREVRSHETRRERQDSYDVEHYPNHDENDKFERRDYRKHRLRKAREPDMPREFSESHFRRNEKKRCEAGAAYRRPESYHTRYQDQSGHKHYNHHTTTDRHTHSNIACEPTFDNFDMYPVWQDLFNFQNQFILAHSRV